MYTRYVKDDNGKILGVVVATATNRVGYALAKPKGNINKDVKSELVTVAAARSALYSVSENLRMLRDLEDRNRVSFSPSNVEFKMKLYQVESAMTDMAYKASKSWSLPTLVENETKRSKNDE